MATGEPDDPTRTGTRSRRGFLNDAAVLAGLGALVPDAVINISQTMNNKYGRYGKLQAVEGKGPELAEILLEAASLMKDAPGCLLYLVGTTADETGAVYVMEVWESEADHAASLQLPGVRELISRAMPILEGRPEGLALNVLGGKGLG